MVVFSDLDRSIIYSKRFLGEDKSELEIEIYKNENIILVDGDYELCFGICDMRRYRLVRSMGRILFKSFVVCIYTQYCFNSPVSQYR